LARDLIDYPAIKAILKQRGINLIPVTDLLKEDLEKVFKDRFFLR